VFGSATAATSAIVRLEHSGSCCQAGFGETALQPLPAPLRLVGYFPASLNADVDVSAGASPKAAPAAAKFIACLRSPAARALFKGKGYRLDP